MSFDYDAASEMLPVVGTAAGATDDGTSFTASLNSDTYRYKSCTFVAVIVTAVAYSAVSWVVQDSPDGTTWTAVDPSLLVIPLPSDLTQTSRVFHCGYVGKQKYVKAALNDGSSTGGGQVTAILTGPYDAPTFQSAITGIEG